jgi:hypothetical protein
MLDLQDFAVEKLGKILAKRLVFRLETLAHEVPVAQQAKTTCSHSSVP